MKTKKNRYERLLEEIQTQKEWIAEHGGTLEGYIANYGDPGIPPAKDPNNTHYGIGGTAIWEADTNKLKQLEANLTLYEYKKDMHIKIETRQEIVLHGVRWANNILVEILANHAAAVSKEGRQALADAIRKITEAENHFRQI